MDENDFEGTLVLEKIAEIKRLDDFFSAIDSDDFAKAQAIMRKAQIDSETISLVLKKMHQADGEH
ncbi:hypothetical protein K2X05_03100 [bacterium]|nr:hypothetical protein [bacterium]